MKVSGIAVFDKKIKGYILFKELKDKIKIEVNLKGLGKNKEHGFHIHEAGNLLDGCGSCKSHFNPYKKDHGSPKSKERHVGDLGNIISNNKGEANYYFYDDKISLRPTKKSFIIGRSIVIHKDKDDLGEGNDKESLVSGNAGMRIGCAVIGFEKGYYF